MNKPGLWKLLILLILLGSLSWWLGQPTSPSSQPSGEPYASRPVRRAPQVAATPPLTRSPSPAPEPAAQSATIPTDPLSAFTEWSTRYLQADEAARATLSAEGRRLAEIRRPAFKDLITTDPRRALAEAVPMVVRQKLPLSVVAMLEERVADRGELRVYAASPDSAERGERPFVRYVETAEGRTFEANVYGRREQDLISKPNASIIGVALDGQIAVSESPLRRLEVGEIPDPQRAAIEVCPVSKLVTTSDVPPGTPVAETVAVAEARDQIIYFCDGAHISVYEQTLIMGESSTGGAQSFSGAMPAAAVPSVGVVKVLYVPAIFADQGEMPTTEAVLHDVLKQVGDFYQTQSYGRLTLVGTITPPIRLPRNQAWYKGKDTTDGFVKEIDGLGAEMAHAKEAARRMGYDHVDYHCFVVRSFGGARSPTSFGSIGAGQVWMRNDSASTVAHEIGHAFALTHANFWLTNGASVAGPGGNEEYGDPYDNMGGGGPPTGHYNVQAKNQVRWLPDEFSPPITASGTYRIHAFDTPRIEQGKRYGLRIVKDNERTYWGEYRTLFPGNVWVTNGLLLGWKWPLNSGSNLQLLDTTPGSIGAKSDAPIALGSTFSDYESGIHVTTLAVNPTTSPPSLDVMVNLGQFASNQPPVASLTPAAPVVPTNSPVTFTASATDPEGDTLSYAWLWHDAVISPNAPVVSRTFATAGVYTVNCVVSDMKGGSAVRKSVITVGNGNSRFAITGRITLDGQGMRGVNVTTSSLNGTLTDSDGYYTISNLTAGTYTVTPAGHGYTFNELFNNSITVGPSFNGANFAVDALPVVTLSLPVPTGTEGDSFPVFRLSRTGSNSQPLAVNVLAVQGTALRGTDYTFVPDYTAVSGTPYQAFTIPADESYLDITVTVANDGAAEGDETVTLVMGLDATYVNAAPVSATATIQDNDTALPRVSLRLSSSQAIEGGGQSLVCTLTRTGSTTAGLSVPVAVSAASSATPGVDYTTLSSPFNIPAGQASATFDLTPLDDALSEPTEFILLNIATSGSFIADAAANSVTARIVDDDTQVVSLTTTDTTAAEVDRAAIGAVPNPGMFLISRTGDTSAPLTVYYSVSGSALHGLDYETLPGSITFPAGQTQLPLAIMPRLDAIGESPETIILGLAAGNGGYQLGSSSSGTVTLADSGAPPVLEVTASSPIASEPSTNGNFRITAKGTGTGTFTVNYTVTGTATAGSDYTTLSGTTNITLNNGTVVQNIPVTILNDAFAEEMETITLTLTPSGAYTLWSETQSATMLLRDDEQAHVFVDPQVGPVSPSTTSTTDVVAEAATTTALKFWISRTGSTTNALVVNYSLAGTATNGADHTNLSGTTTIPASAPGIDVSFNTIADTTFEGTETIKLHLEPGSYGRGPDATIYITDDDAGTQSVAFASPGGSGSEADTTVNIPVTLTNPATAPVTVEYALDSGARTPTFMNGSWVRVVRTGNSFQTFTSLDGASWSSVGTARTLTMSSTSYFAGVAVTSSASGTGAVIQVDNVSVTGLSGGGSAGAITAATVGTMSPVGSHVEAGGLFEVFAGGGDISTSGTTDVFRYIYFPISNSTDCTITARVLNSNCSTSSARAGVMIRETTTATSMHGSVTVNLSGTMFQAFRLTNGGNAGNQLLTPTTPNLAKPTWLRLSRSGNVFTAYASPDGTTFTQVGVPQSLPLSSQVLIGMAASSRTDGTLAQATFDNLTISPPPAGAIEGRNIGFVNEPGGATNTGGTYSITASGAGFLASTTAVEDEGYLVGTSVTGDFTMTARVTGIPVGPANSQAGLMIRESANHRARCLLISTGKDSPAAVDFKGRFSSTSSGEGFGVDYSLPTGTLTFDIGEQTKNIVLNVSDDSLPEPVEFATVLLRNANAALLGPQNSFTYSIVDNDAPSAAILPVVGFSAPSAQNIETATPIVIPVVLSEASASTVTVDYTTTAGGTALSGTDFTPISGTVTFAPGETFQTLSLPILDDTTVEPNETVVLSLSNPANAVIGTSAQHTYTIGDDDSPLVTITASDATATEGGDSGTFTMTRTGPTTAALTVNFVTTGSTASSGADYTAFSPLTSLTIPIGQSSANLVVAPVQNTTPEVPETVIVTVTSGSGYFPGVAASATVTITDDEVNTISIVATDATASEVPGNGGEFTLTRTGPLGAALTVNVTITGTATNGTDCTAISASRSFLAGESTSLIPVAISLDSLTEGNEELLISISTNSSYIVGSPSVASVTIVDDDLPPTVYISSPASKSTIVAPGNGLMLEATAEDDGLPNPLAYTWSQLFGPGTVSFGTANAASTAAAFSANGVYGIRVTVSDGQFSATDDLFVQSGGFAYANWVSVDQGPPGIRGVSGESNGVFTLIGSGAGYSSAADSGHMMFRQLLGSGGEATIIARVASLSGAATRLAGITMRDTSWRGAKRVNLVLDGAGTLQFRARNTANNADSATTTPGQSSPLWLRLVRSAGTITGSYAADVGDAPGTWITAGTSSVSLSSNLSVGMVTSAGIGTAVTATAVFDNVSVTPSFSGPALHSEDLGLYVLAGSSSEAGGTVTLNGTGFHDGSGGHFRYQQIWGDCLVTARLLSHSGATRGAQSGIAVRDITDSGPFGFYGMTTTDGFQAHWRSSPNGTPGTLQTSGSVGFWLRLMRRGNTIVAFRAPNVGGVPGTWAQATGNLPAALGGPLLFGYLQDSNNTAQTATGTYTGLTIEPLNVAPIVNAGDMAATLPPFLLDATITDDGKPNPPATTASLWSKVSGPGTVSFGNPAIEDTLATLSVGGAYILRLTADDGDSRTFDDLSFSGFSHAFEQWQHQHFASSSSPDAAHDADPDFDGLANLLEYGFATSGAVPNPNPAVLDIVTVGPDRFLRLTIPKNNAASDVIYEVQATGNLHNPLTWSGSGLVIELDTETTLRVRDNVPITPAQQRFMRLQVTR